MAKIETFYPLLYRWDTTDFTAQSGYGPIICTECTVTEEINGEFTLELVCDKDAANAREITPGAIIYSRINPTGQAEPFRIYQTQQGYDTIHARGNHISYDLSGCVARPTETTTASVACRYVRREAEANNGYPLLFWKIEDTTGATGDWTLKAPRSVRACMLGEEGSIIDRYGGEWIFDHFDCTLVKRRGTDRGARVVYGVNMTDYQYTHTAAAYSHVIAYATITTGTAEEPEEETICGEAVPTGLITTKQTLILDADEEFTEENPPTTAKLTQYTRDYITSHKAELTGDTITTTADPETLDASVPVLLGDTVKIIYPDRVTEARVTRMEYNPLTNRYTNLTIGTPQKNLAQTIRGL